MGSEATDLVLSNASKKYLVPYADAPNYEEELFKILDREKPDLIHFQNDLEVYKASKIRDKIIATGTNVYMPDHEVIDTCVNKFKSYLKWKDSNIKVPTNRLIHNEDDLKEAFEELGDENQRIWLRASSIGGGGKGALPTNDFEFARGWIDRYAGWGIL